MTYQRDLKKLIVSLDSLTNGQASVTVDEENVGKFILTIIPDDGPYRNGKFDFEITFDDPSGYPADLPEVICTTPICHPNIENEYDGTNVCLSLFDEWDSNSLADIVQGLLFLFYNPNIEDPLSSLFDGSETEDEFTERVRLSLMGELEIDGTSFTRNQVNDDNNSAPASDDTVNTDTPNDTREINTPHTNMYTNDDTLETNIDNSCNDKIIIMQKTSDNDVHESHTSEEHNSQASNPTGKAVEVAENLDKQDLICTTVSSESTSGTVSHTSNQKNNQTWNVVLGTVTTLLMYLGFANCGQHFYEISR